MQSITRTPFTLVARATRTVTPAPMRGVATSSANFYNEQPRFSTTNANANAVHSLGREQPHTQPLTNNKGGAAGYTTFAGPSSTTKNSNISYGGTANRERNSVWCVAGAAGTQKSFGNVPMGAFAVCEEFGEPWRRSI
jgi:hypothetical protein